VIKNRKVSTFLNLPGVVSVETDSRGRLWAGTVNLAGGPGSIVKINTK
jgi:hypothetical protein